MGLGHAARHVPSPLLLLPLQQLVREGARHAIPNPSAHAATPTTQHPTPISTSHPTRIRQVLPQAAESRPITTAVVANQARRQTTSTTAPTKNRTRGTTISQQHDENLTKTPDRTSRQATRQTRRRQNRLTAPIDKRHANRDQHQGTARTANDEAESSKVDNINRTVAKTGMQGAHMPKPQACRQQNGQASGP